MYKRFLLILSTFVLILPSISLASNLMGNQVHISGYTDVEYYASEKEGDKPEFRIRHMTLFAKKRIDDNWRFFSELQYENGPTSETINQPFTVIDTDGNPQEVNTLDQTESKVSLESANLTYRADNKFFRIGRFFTPAGIWSIDHYPSFVRTQIVPQHIRRIFPKSIDGAMVFGSVKLGGARFMYDIYTGNGEGNSGGNDNNSEKSKGVRMGFLAPWMKRFEIGSTYYTDTLNDQSEKTSRGYHAKFQVGFMTLQGEFAKSEIKPITGPIVNSKGYYTQISLRFGRFDLGLRHDVYDNNTGVGQFSDVFGEIQSSFINYHPAKDIVIKAEVHNVDVEDELAEDYRRAILSIVAYLQ